MRNGDGRGPRRLWLNEGKFALTTSDAFLRTLDEVIVSFFLFSPDCVFTDEIKIWKRVPSALLLACSVPMPLEHCSPTSLIELRTVRFLSGMYVQSYSH